MKKKVFKILYLILGVIIILEIAFFLVGKIKGPTLVLNGAKSIIINLNEEYQDPGFKIIFASNKLYSVTIIENINNKVLGDYEVTYMFLNQKITRKVTVVDKISPTINLKGNNISYVCPNKEYEEEGYTAIDNYDGDITKEVKIVKEKDFINYEVTDNSSNKTETKRKLVYNDITPPVINLVIGSNIKVTAGTNYKDNYTAIDNCDGDITTNVKITGEVNTNVVGTYELNYEVMDSYGNKSTAKRIVQVTAKVMYTGSVIYLTFDDGPSRDVTPGLLDVLNKYDIKATFFVVNRSNMDDIIKRQYDEGHTIGLHSYTHKYNIYTSEETYFADLNAIENKIISITGESSKIIRFPGGSSNTVSKNYNKGIMSKLTRLVEEKGYTYFDWNVGSSDTVTSDANKICDNVKKRLGRGNNVVLMHDYSGKTETIEATECIIKYGLDYGYTFKSLTKSSYTAHHGVNN